MTTDNMTAEIDRLRAALAECRHGREHWIQQSKRLREACEAVIGHGYCKIKHPASQDYVSKSAIVKVRSALRETRKGSELP